MLRACICNVKRAYAIVFIDLSPDSADMSPLVACTILDKAAVPDSEQTRTAAVRNTRRMSKSVQRPGMALVAALRQTGCLEFLERKL
jgi:hypothetical protein